MADMPCARDVREYLESSGLSISWDRHEIERALEAEACAQGRVCRVPQSDDEWPDDLAQALLRRVARNFALRKLPLGIAASEIETRITGSDIEVRRLEAPHRRWVVA
jgi:hypothetical protein